MDVNTHLYVPDATVAPNHRGERPCTCGSLKRDSVHWVPDTSDAQAEQRRWTGENT